MKIRKLILLGLIASGIFCTIRALRACMDLPETLFTGRIHPDDPLIDYARGKLGVVQPTYYRADLFVAYRNLAGLGFTPEETSALWPWKPANDINPGSGNKIEAVEKWLGARGKIPGVEEKKDLGWKYWGPFRLVSENGYSFQSYLNCGDDAFRNATATLDARAAKFGGGSEWIRDWVAAQDDVFDNCQQGEHLPPALNPDAPALLRADRQYQLAAAYFYSGNFEKAGKLYADIAEDDSSPWSVIAPYLEARCLIRKATVGHEDGKPDIALLTQADLELKNAIANPKLKPIHASSQKLLGFVEARVHPQERLLEMVAALMKKNPPDLAQDLRDYTWLLDQVLDQPVDEPDAIQKTEPRPTIDLDQVMSRDDMTDWILTFQRQTPAALAHALEKWEKTRSTPWLAAAMAKIPADDPKVPELIAAAEKLPAKSPGYAWATFNVVRLLAQSGKRTEARKRMGVFMAANRSSLPPSTLNLFLALGTNLSTSLNEFLKDSQRVPVEGGGSYGYNEDKPLTGPRFDMDTATVINEQMPLSMLEEIAGDKSLSVDQRRQVAGAAWTRAVMFGDEASAVRLVPVLEELLPTAKDYLEAYRTAPSPEARHFAAAYFLLKFPGMRPYIPGVLRTTPWDRIDDLHENWWSKGGLCGMNWQYSNYLAKQQPAPKEPTLAFLEIPQTLAPIYPGGKIPPPGFLTRAQQEEAKKQLATLVALPGAPLFMTESTLVWARAHPDDPRVPEALHRAVMANRFGCGERETNKFSKQAFELLHTRYPNDPWTKRTKYWYGSQLQ